jgi:transcriptional regulator with XRE-family HTH domain
VTAGFREMWSSNGEAEAPEQALTPQGTSPIPFGRLISLRRRDSHLTMEQLADKANIDLGELVTIEAGQCSDPQPRTVHALAQALSLPSDKLFVVSGLKFSTDQRFNNQAVRFAARSEAVDKLNKEEQQALQEFVKYLSEK